MKHDDWCKFLEQYDVSYEEKFYHSAYGTVSSEITVYGTFEDFESSKWIHLIPEDLKTMTFCVEDKKNIHDSVLKRRIKKLRFGF